MSSAARLIPTGLALVATIVLGGCASALSGLGGTESFACKAPIGAQCTSISGVYANASPVSARGMDENSSLPLSYLTASRISQALPLDHAGRGPTRPATSVTVGVSATTSAAALRSSPRVLRVWIAPWEDADGDLHDASFLHVVADTGRWLIERVRPAPRSMLDIATPPLAPATTPVPTPEGKPSADIAPTEP